MFYAMDLLNVMEDSSLCNSMPMNLHRVRETDCVWSETAVPVPKRRRRRSERTEVSQARVDRRRIYGEESVTFSRSIGVELDSESSIVSTCTEQLKI